MTDDNANRVVYHIDVELLKRAREKALQAEIKKLDEQIGNAQQDLLMIKTAEIALAKVQIVLEEMRKIAVQSAENPKADRKALSRRLEMQKKKIDEIISLATFDGVNLLDGSMGSINSIIAAVKAALK